MFVGKANGLPKRGHLERLERLAGDKHSSLFCFFVGDEDKKSFETPSPGGKFADGCRM